jgi:hypothetical protein
MSSLKLPGTNTIHAFNVLAYDPGGTTGWSRATLGCEYDGAPADDLSLDDIHIQTGEFTGDHHMDIYTQIRKLHADSFLMNLPKLEVVSEPFHYRQNIVGEGEGFRGKVELVSAEYIGIIKLACAQLGLTYYDRFTPGEAKRYVTDQKLELLGWLQEPRHPMRHRNDALRQLVKYLIVKRGIQHPLTTVWRRK